MGRFLLTAKDAEGLVICVERLKALTPARDDMTQTLLARVN
jgi:hypothetical protein